MIIELGKVTEETCDNWPLKTALDGSPFPPFVYYQIGGNGLRGTDGTSGYDVFPSHDVS